MERSGGKEESKEMWVRLMRWVMRRDIDEMSGV